MFLCKLNPVTAVEEQAPGPSMRDLPPQADHVLVDLFSSVAAGGALQVEPPHTQCLLPKPHSCTSSQHLLATVTPSALATQSTGDSCPVA